MFRSALLNKLIMMDDGKEEVGINALRDQLLLTSKELLNYPNKLQGGQYIERKELATLVDTINDKDCSTTLILGSPGSGKSSLLSILANQIKGESVSLLAIKADALGKNVNTDEDLKKHLHLSLETRDIILALAEKQKTVLIIDQLDAVSELLDQKSGRLNVLLNLIYYLSNIKNIHIIASSREFEYHHDIRLNSINAEKIVLEAPVWEQIVPVLKNAGHQTENMTEILKELLRTPLHLKIFLDIARPGVSFDSLHSLLNELWEQKVLNTQLPKECMELLNYLAQRMSEDEVLWLPASITDNFSDARRCLEQNEILVRGEGGQTIGFRHQTYYDYTLTRLFTSGSVPLTDYVLERQDGLFVRPTFLSCLYYLRSTSIAEYHKQIGNLFQSRLRPYLYFMNRISRGYFSRKTLFKTRLRSHIWALLIEFLGEQKNPDDTEAYYLLPLLAVESPKILSAVAGSQGWFRLLCNSSSFKSKMRGPVDVATQCIPVLAEAIKFASIEVFNLVKESWVDDPSYDFLTLGIMIDFKDWDENKIPVAETLAKRTDFWSTPLLIETIAKAHAELGPRVLRVYLDKKFVMAQQEIKNNRDNPDQPGYPSVLPLHNNRPLEVLITDRIDNLKIEDMAKAAPKEFIEYIWPWFMDVLKKVADEEHPFIWCYRPDTAVYRLRSRDMEGSIVNALLSAVSIIAENDSSVFWDFVNDNIDADLLTVHRIIARGMALIASSEPNKIYYYLVGDPRRLSIGNYDDPIETKRLIRSVYPYLGDDEKIKLEDSITSFNQYKEVLQEWTAEDRRKRILWNRQHRLRLLKALPDEYTSERVKRLKKEEERVFPEVSDSVNPFFSGIIGPRINKDRMKKASDTDLLNLFNELPDEATTFGKMLFKGNYHLSGGSSQQAHEFYELAKEEPTRAVGIIRKLKAKSQERYAAAGIDGLAESLFPADELINLIRELHDKGFTAPRY